MDMIGFSSESPDIWGGMYYGRSVPVIVVVYQEAFPYQNSKLVLPNIATSGETTRPSRVYNQACHPVIDCVKTVAV